MVQLAWTHASTVGIQAMDDQHGVLLDALNALRQGLAHGADSATASRLIQELVLLTRLHFESEEKLLRRFDFPDLASHVSEHRNMLARLEQYAACLEHRQSTAMRTIVESLGGWFTGHAEGCDQLYGPWLREHGVS